MSECFSEGAKAQIDAGETPVLISSRFHRQEAKIDKMVALQRQLGFVETSGDLLGDRQRGR